MRKSIPAFICGLIGSLWTMFWGFWVGIIGEAVGSMFGGADSAPAVVTVIYILGWLAFIGGIVGIVGCSFALKNTKKAQWNLLIAAITSTALLGYLFIKSLASTQGVMIATQVLLYLLPAVLLIVSTVLSFTTKDNGVPAQPQMQNYAQPMQNAQPTQPTAPAQKSLEDELVDLKNMKDKGLLTDEEYAEAKKAALAKYSK